MKMRRVAFIAVTVTLGVVVVILSCELLLRFFSPQPYYYPRYELSAQERTNSERIARSL